MNTFIALLRGINVGGNNIIKMAPLKACFEKLGFCQVTTYIQSGNILFQAPRPAKELTDQIEETLSKQFRYNSCVVLISHSQLKRIVELAPKNFGQNADTYRYDVIFLKKPVTPKNAIKVVKTKEGVDNVHAGKYTLYFSRLISGVSQSHMSRIIQTPIYQHMTIRNWNTTKQLLTMAEGLSKSAHALESQFGSTSTKECKTKTNKR